MVRRTIALAGVQSATRATMDPHEALTMLVIAFDTQDWEAVEEIATNLREWIEGGFGPTVTGRESFDRVMIKATLGAVLEWEFA